MRKDVFSENLEAINVKNFVAAILFSLKCCGISTEAIEMLSPIRLVQGVRRKPVDFFIDL